MSNLHSIAEWEKVQPTSTHYQEILLRQGFVHRVIGTYNSTPCRWDGYGLAYHPSSGKRFKSADVEFLT